MNVLRTRKRCETPRSHHTPYGKDASLRLLQEPGLRGEKFRSARRICWSRLAAALKASADVRNG